jgi:hypothetical protein
MRVSVLIGGLIVATLYLGLESASARRAQVGAWCARVNTGANRVQENCTFDSVEACRRTVLSGNRGFCSRNPAYKKRRSSER